MKMKNGKKIGSEYITKDIDGSIDAPALCRM